VLGAGDPFKSKYMLTFEAPGKDEIAFRLHPVPGRAFFATQAEVDAEIARRRKAFPNIEAKYLKTGVPIVGASGTELEMWAFPKAGVLRQECFVDNTIRCLYLKSGKVGYPIGEEKKAAELACRQYDRLSDFRPDVALVTLHPAGILREITPLPLQIKDFERARDFAAAGLRPLVLLGGKAAHAFLRYAENVQKWRGHYAWLGGGWLQKYKSLFAFTAKKKRKPGPKVGAKAHAARLKAEVESFTKWDHLFSLTPGSVRLRHRRGGKKSED
jgi:uracil-DNA glycosylase